MQIVPHIATLFYFSQSIDFPSNNYPKFFPIQEPSGDVLSLKYADRHVK